MKSCGLGCAAWIEVVLTIVDPGCIFGTAAWQRWNIARMFVRNTKSSSSGGMSRNDS